MAITPTRSSTKYQSSGTSIVATFAEGTALDSSYLLVACLQVASATAVTAPSGWTELAGGGSNGSNQVRVYARAGDGSTNSVTITIPSASATLTIAAWAGYAGLTAIASSGTTGTAATSRSQTVAAAPARRGIALSVVGVAGTVTWGAWTGATRVGATTGSTSVANASQLMDVGCAEFTGPSFPESVAWTTSRTQRYMQVVLPIAATAATGASWKNALTAAAAGTGQAKIFTVGDSMMEGEGASAEPNRFMSRFADGVRSNRAIGGSGFGMVGAFHTTYLTDSSSWRTPTTADTGTISNNAQGDRGVYLGSTGAYVQWTRVCTSFDVVHYQGTGDGSSIGVNVDGINVTTIDISSGAASYSSISHVAIGGPAASHVITLTLTGGGDVVDGIVLYNGDETAGVIAWDGTHVGYDSTDFGGTNPPGSLVNGIANLQPALVIDDITGLTDYQSNATAPAQAAANLAARLTFYKAQASSPTVMLLACFAYDSSRTTANAGGYTWQQYLDACRLAASSFQEVYWIDLHDVYPSFTWLASDGAHPSDAGHQKIADALLAILAPGTSPAFYGLVSGSLVALTAQRLVSGALTTLAAWMNLSA